LILLPVSPQEIHERGENQRIEQVDQDRPNAGDNQECGRGLAPLLGESLHIGNTVRHGAEAETAEAGAHDCCVVVLSKDHEAHEDHEDRDEENLGRKGDDHGQGKVHELPEL